MPKMEMVDRALALEAEIKERKRELDGIKAALQGEALAVMEDRNLKFYSLAGENGLCNVAYKEKLEIDSLEMLKAVVGDLVESKIKVTTEVKYAIDPTFKDALIALYKGDYAEADVDGILAWLGLDDGQVKAAKKRLKGEYVRDLAYLQSLGITGDVEEELDAIRGQKNFDLVERFFGTEAIDLAGLRKAIFVEDGLAIGLVGLEG